MCVQATISEFSTNRHDQIRPCFIAICYRREVSQLHSLYDNEMRHVTDDAKARKSHFVLFVYDHSLSCKSLQLTSRYTVLVSSSMTLQSGRTIKATNATTSRDKPLSIQFDTQLHTRSWTTMLGSTGLRTEREHSPDKVSILLMEICDTPAAETLRLHNLFYATKWHSSIWWEFTCFWNQWISSNRNYLTTQIY